MSQLFVAGPPGAGPRDAAARWVDRIERRGYAGPAGLIRDAAHSTRLRAYLSDLLRPYGLALREGPFEGQSYGEMADAFLDPDTGDPDTGDPDAVDLIVLAYAIPDITPGRATATYLSHRGAGTRLAFAICDQGAAAPFTGLRLIQEYAATGGCRRAMLIVVEQSELPYDPRVPVDVPAAHSAVALWLGPSEQSEQHSRALRVGPVRQRSGLAAGDAADLLAREASDAALILGGDPRAVPLPPGRKVHLAEPGRPCTGAWWELAGLLTAGPIGPGGPDPVLVAAYDRGSRCLSTCRLDPAGPG